MKAIAAMRNQFGGHAVRTGPPPGGDINPDEGASPGSAPGSPKG
jgi:6-phosphogluconate dehydrogenase